MKKGKPEKFVFGIGGVLLLIVSLAAFVDFGAGKSGQPAREDRLLKNPWEDLLNTAQTGRGNPGNNAGIMNIAVQNPVQQRKNDGKFLMQQAQINRRLIKTLQLSEAHWQGMELMELTPELKMKFRYPMEMAGLMVDEVTLNAMLSGVVGGDVLQAVNGKKVKSLRQFQELTRRIRNQSKAKLTVWRQGKTKKFKIKSGDVLGLAQMESAPMILAGEMRPHPYRGACTSCHLIGESVTIQPDPDGIILPPPAIQAKSRRPHRDRGPCKACHVIVR